MPCPRGTAWNAISCSSSGLVERFLDVEAIAPVDDLDKGGFVLVLLIRKYGFDGALQRGFRARCYLSHLIPRSPPIRFVFLRQV